MLEDFVKKSYQRSKKVEDIRLIFNSVPVHIKDPLPENIDLNKIINFLETTLPRFYFHNLDLIYIGQFEHLIQREINAMYDSGAIYLSNDQDDEQDVIDDIIHETSHMIEEIYGSEIYLDKNIENEFLGKRKRLERILRFQEYDTSLCNFLNPEYSKDLDDFLYKKVGYPKLSTLSTGLYLSPYAATSIKEYFAIAFEEFYIGDKRLLKNISPAAYEKIEYIDNIGENYELDSQK